MYEALNIKFQLLKKDNIPYKALTNFKKYTIVDNERPKLCADRFDGIILTGIAWTKTLSCNDIIEITSDLTVYDNEHGEKELGFKTNPNNRIVNNINEVIEFINYATKNRDNLPYDIDGVVIKVNDINMQKQETREIVRRREGSKFAESPLQT